MTETRPPYAELDRWITEKLAFDGTPGLSLAITDRDRTLHVGTYGYADISADMPVSPDHAFEIGSIGKSFTAMLLLMMQEHGEIDLHAPVSNYLPWFEVQSAFDPITVHHLLTHTAGIIEGSDMAADSRFETWHLRNTIACAAPGAHFHYSNIGYKTLGFVIEELLGVPYGEAVTERVLKPLGMTASFSPITDAERGRTAVGYRRAHPERPWKVGEPLGVDTWFETFTADGSISSTPHDMAIYARALLARGHGLVTDESFAKMIGDFGPHPEHDPTATYGYGLMTWQDDGPTMIGHSGGMVGYFAQLTLDPDLGIGVAVMINGPGEPAAFADEAMKVATAIVRGGAVPALPPIVARHVITDAAELAGTYTSGDMRWTLEADNDRVALVTGDLRVPLEQRRKDRLFANHPGFDQSMIAVKRREGQVTGLSHGASWFDRDGVAVAPSEPAPAEWQAYVGWFRCHNPWLGLIHVIERRGELLLAWASGAETPLIPLGDGVFQLDASPSPERIRFDAIADGVALRADLNGQGYYRTTLSSVERQGHRKTT